MILRKQFSAIYTARKYHLLKLKSRLLTKSFSIAVSDKRCDSNGGHSSISSSYALEYGTDRVTDS